MPNYHFKITAVSTFCQEEFLRNLFKAMNICIFLTMVVKYSRREVEKWQRMIKFLWSTGRIRKGAACKRIHDKYGVPLQTIVGYTVPSNYRKQSKRYNSRYVRIKRKIDKIFPEVFNGDKELSLKEIASRIDDRTTILFQEKRLEDILGKYAVSKGVVPLVQTGAGNYCLNPEFYAR